MEIHESDFVLTPVSDDGNLYDLRFYKRVKKKDTGKYELELGNPIYGLTLSDSLIRIAKHRVAKKYENDNITLFTYLKTLQAAYKAIVKLCRESLPEKFDTGD